LETSPAWTAAREVEEETHSVLKEDAVKGMLDERRTHWWVITESTVMISTCRNYYFLCISASQ
jgi:hypothetical protein